MSAPLVEFSGIEKAFFRVKVLRGVSFSVPRAGAVGLVGENGAGKSTLMNIFGGNLAPDGGEMRLAGNPYAPARARDAESNGIAFIHQELNLFPNLSIAENLFLTRFPSKRGTALIDYSLLEERTTGLLEQVGLDAAPGQLVEKLSTGERQLVEIAKALSIDARVIIFDEPTTSLSGRETERLFVLIRKLRDRGIACIYISHVLKDVFELCEQIVVLRDGAVVGDGPATSFTHSKLVALMVGREITQLFPPHKGLALGEPLLEVRNLTSRGKLEDISLTVHRGEILGLAGLMGAGRSELARSIFGLDPRTAGQVIVRGQPLKSLHPRAAMQNGVAFLTENRGSEGLCLNSSVSDNLTLASLPHHVKRPFKRLNLDTLRAAVERIRTVVALDPKATNLQPARALSGGNQQKIVLGKWLLNKPELFILDEPTRGIDVGAKSEIYRLILELAKNGSGVLAISSEIEELIGICDRILVLSHGRIVREFTRDQFDREEILRAALGTA
jgi:ribose transport system ATP-binding protein